VTVTGGGFTDTWEWQFATDRFAPATLRGRRAGGFNVVVDDSSAPPKP
jgi:hypothetical protein